MNATGTVNTPVVTRPVDISPPGYRPRQALARSAASVLLALLAILALRDILGPIGYWLALLPVYTIGWYYGPLTGGAAGVLVLIVNRTILRLLDVPPVASDPIPTAAAFIAAAAAGAVIGRLGDAQRESIARLAERDAATRQLRESEERYRRLLVEAQHQAQALALRDRVRTALIGVLDRATAFRTVVEAIAATYGYTQVSLYILEGDHLILQHQVGYDQVIERMPITRGVMGRVVRTGAAALVADVANDPDYWGALDGVTSEVAAPILDDGRAIGVLNVESAGNIALGEGDLRVMEALCEYVGVIIERTRLHTAISASEQRYRSVIEQAREVIFQTDLEGVWTFLNPAWAAITGFVVAESLGESVRTFVHPDDWAACARAYRELTGGGATERRFGARLRSRDGDHRWCEVQLGALRDDAGRASGIAGIINDVTEQKAMTEALRRSEAELRAIFDGAGIGIVLADAAGRIVKANRAFTALLGYAEGEMDGMPLAAVTYPGDRPQSLTLYDEALAGQRGHCQIEKRYVRKDETVIWVRLTVSTLLDAAGGVQYLVGMVEDISARKAAEEARRASEERLQTVVANAPVALFAFNREGIFTLAEGQGLNLLGMTAGGIVGRSLFAVFEQAPWIVEQMQRALAGEAFTAIAERAGLAFETSYTPIRDEQGAVTGAIGVATDVTRRTAIEAQLTHQAYHDPLTDLPNRARFMDRLEVALGRAREHGETIALLFLDLDRFKVVNDSLGHDTGDQLLIAVAARLLSCVRPGDTVARLGGDEFTILLDGLLSEREAARVAERVTAALRRPFEIGGHEVVLTTSIGVVLSQAWLGLDNPTDLLRYADMAMYQAKGAGKARYAIFDRRMGRAALARLELEADLRRSIEREEFALEYQPLLDLRSGAIVGTEALVRWHHPQRGLVSPATFIPIAEETGLILPLGRWILREACRQTRQWQAQFAHHTGLAAPPLTISVNLSARQFQDPDLVADIARLLAETGLPAASLKLEITETILMEEAEATSGTLEALQRLGVALAIDDFGTGYSSLAYLKRFPVNAIKVDRTFVAGLAASPEDEAIIGAVVTLAHGIGLQVCAEGVETHAQLAHLRRLGVDHGQGYYFSRPLAPAALAALLAAGGFLLLDGTALAPAEPAEAVAD